ncbi:zeta toxin family protein [Aestuariibacter sp. AA17]|uniref:Zeta toxin family protein n=1 Tax=Fluctibacter corallii TaxID=2984329 RepID=A0ABT3A852_9ALTE|nr:zeta toxin family protein [Aestuariibacter sp. AA17]MCV2884795.1 zeta toxin family protein [Aestuariibacter sp. AA17]
MTLSEEELAIQERAIAWAKANRTRIANELTCKNKFPPEENPVSIFMAGSPGAGKTETSKKLIENLDGQGRVVRIDADELREHIPNYNGTNSYLFHRAVSFIVERIVDNVFKRKQSFILDGTLSKYSVAEKNIDRALLKNRLVVIVYVYMEPVVAWDFVQRREAVEGRRIEKEVFIDQFFAAKEVVNKLKASYRDRVKVMLFSKDLTNDETYYKDNISSIDNHVKQKYTPASLEQALSD